MLLGKRFVTIHGFRWGASSGNSTKRIAAAMAQDILFAGNPNSMYRQIMAFYDKVGGFGYLALVGRLGPMTHEESETSIRLFTREVLPRLREIRAAEVG